MHFENYEVYCKWTGSNPDIECTIVHVSDDTVRIVMIESRALGSDSSIALLKRFIYSSHLQSELLELNDSGANISYEEYHPYGTTASVDGQPLTL
jgi:hypothetical protein